MLTGGLGTGTQSDSPVWERLWIFRFSSLEKLLLQVGQRWGFSLVCVRMWISILYLQSRSRSQWGGGGDWLLSTVPALQQLGVPASKDRGRASCQGCSESADRPGGQQNGQVEA